MKRLLIIASVAAVLVVMLAALAIPALADKPGDDEAAGEAMHQACENGDWEAMAEAAEQFHTEDHGSTDCHDEDGAAGGMMSGMMGH